jgi:hypothetical protein
MPIFRASTNGLRYFMALDPSEMASFIIGEMRHGASSQRIMEMMGHAMAKYLCSHTEVLFSWSGKLPADPYTPDPVASYITMDVQGDFFLVHTKTNNPYAAARHLALQIQKECGKLTIGPKEGWDVPRIKFNNHSPPPIAPTRSNDQVISMRRLCTWILNMYKTYINPTPLMGSHGSFFAPPGSGAVMQKIF